MLSVGMWLCGVCLLALLPVVLMPRIGPAPGLGVTYLLFFVAWQPLQRVTQRAWGPRTAFVRTMALVGTAAVVAYYLREALLELVAPGGMIGAAPYTRSVRALGIDYGARRLGLALSDASGTLASPWRVIERPPSEAETVRMMLRRDRQAGGRGRRAGGGGDRLAAAARRLADRQDAAASRPSPAPSSATPGSPVVLQDERLSSVEAESRLAARERDWRVRKRKLDAAAAAVVLQDYLDARPRA